MSQRQKSAILVGCGYYGRGENDVETIEEVLLEKFGFLPENITKLIQPSRVDIQNALNNMKDKAGKGDVLCFYFSGSVRVNQADNIPAIYSSDDQPIPATDFQSLANQLLAKKISFTLILESSDSAQFINPVATNDNRILFCASSRANEKRACVIPDADNNTKAFGMFTYAIKMASHDHPTPVTNEQLLEHVNRRLQGFNQHAGLFLGVNNPSAPFLGYL